MGHTAAGGFPHQLRALPGGPGGGWRRGADGGDHRCSRYLRAGGAQGTGCFSQGCPGGQDVIHEKDSHTAQISRRARGHCSVDVLSPGTRTEAFLRSRPERKQLGTPSIGKYAANVHPCREQAPQAHFRQDKFQRVIAAACPAAETARDRNQCQAFRERGRGRLVQRPCQGFRQDAQQVGMPVVLAGKQYA